MSLGRSKFIELCIRTSLGWEAIDFYVQRAGRVLMDFAMGLVHPSVSNTVPYTALLPVLLEVVASL